MIHARGVYHAHAACPPHGARERRIGRRAANCHVCYHLRTEAPLTTQLVTKEPAMKGIVFAQFAELVESKFGTDMVDTLIEKTNPPSGGVYVATGTYDHSELVAMVVELSKQTQVPVPDLLISFGKFLMPRFRASFPQFFDPHHRLFDFLESVHGYIHIEVRKLYPDAMLPTLSCQRVSDNRMDVIYNSSRHLGDFGRGLIEGAAEQYRTKVRINPVAVDNDTIRFEVEIVDTR